jgi:hypothetical protein
VRVTDTCGDLHLGDLLAPSPVEGHAERQCNELGADALLLSNDGTPPQRGGVVYDPVQRPWTLGKTLVEVRWADVVPSPDGVRRKLIPVTLYP